MIVLKFGGTSVGSVDAIQAVRGILESYQQKEHESLFVVCSAFGGVTNQLVEILKLTETGDTSYTTILTQLETRHVEAVRGLMNPLKQGEVLAEVKVLFNELEDLLAGICLLKEVTPKSSDLILSFGERLSSLIVFQYLNSQLKEVGFLDPRQIILCANGINRGEVQMAVSREKATKVKPALKEVTVCPGFIAADAKGDIVTLGRGGSDYTAALFANFLDASRLEIWSDVDGLMTADPRLVPNAHVLNTISYEEALELSHFGAKVIYPPSIQPAMTKEVPIIIRNTFNIDNPGTTIINQFEDQAAIKGISSIKDITLLNLRGGGMVGIPRFSYRLFETLSAEHINVVIITQASSEHTICVGIESKDREKAEQAINTTFEIEIGQGKLLPVEVEDKLGIIALVGNNMKDQVGVSGQMFSTLGRNGVSIKAIAQGSSERNISVVINQKDLSKAVNSLHESFFTEELRRVNLFLVGAGNVGKALLSQIAKQQPYLREHHLIDLHVMAIANSKKMIFSQSGEGISLNAWKEALDGGGLVSIRSFLDQMIELNLRNSVFLDVTPSNEVAAVYPEILKKSISIATPNKIAATGSQESYALLKTLQRKYKSQFLFETNVCAGLPVISTLADLVKSGDRIHRIEAVLSGTLNFLFNTYEGRSTFASIVQRAKDEGYSEPDPRLDLSGEDVRRKILILARESGYKLEIGQIKSKPFVPESCMNAPSVEAFFIEVGKNEAFFQKLVDEAKTADKKLRYVAKFENGSASTGLEMVDDSHPFAQLEGSDNIVLFYTDRYAKQPLVIKGAGAGAEVTASGIFADIMRIAAAN